MPMRAIDQPGAIAILLGNRTAICAVLVLAGSALGQMPSVAQAIAVEWWLVLAVCMLALWMADRLVVGRRIHCRFQTLCMAAAVIALAAGRSTAQSTNLTQRDLTRVVDSEPDARIWHLRGSVRTEPVIHRTRRGAMARFMHFGTVTTFTLEVDAAIGTTDESAGEPAVVPIDGAVIVRIEDADDRWVIGDRVTVRGLLHGFSQPLNPGEFDWRERAHRRGLAGSLTVTHRANIQLQEHAQGLTDRFLAWRSRIRRQVAQALLSDIGLYGDSPEESLLAALIIGDRGIGLDGIDETFRRTGLAHLLAISGLHLGILALVVMAACRLIGISPQAERSLVVLFVLLYVFLVPVRVPIWRAAVMLLVAMGAQLTGRRVSGLSVLALAAMIVTVWKPDEVVAPGFQLSFGVVTGLVLLTSPTRQRWFGPGPDDPETLPWSRVAVEYVKSTVTAVIVAWLISTPLVVHHFAYLCPLAPIASIPAFILVTVILCVGFVKIAIALLIPGIAAILSPILSHTSAGLIGMIEWLDRVPLSSVVVGSPPALWTCVTLVLLTLWLGSSSRNPQRRKRVIRVLCVLLIPTVWLLADLSGWGRDVINRVSQPVQMLTVAVGNGSCHVIRVGPGSGGAIMFDCGSGDYADAGIGTIVPALRRHGILCISTLIISHDDIDHFSASIEVMREMQIRRLIVTPQMLEAARAWPAGPASMLLSTADTMGVEVLTCSAGDALAFDNGIRFDWLHPRPGDRFSVDNDASAVIRVDLGAVYAHRTILLTGDAQGGAADLLRVRYPATMLQADVMELPHHGAWANGGLQDFLLTVAPGVVIQSTGAARVRRDPWSQSPVMRGRQRYITARDGMIVTTISPGGQIDVRQFVSNDS